MRPAAAPAAPAVVLAPPPPLLRSPRQPARLTQHGKYLQPCAALCSPLPWYWRSGSTAAAATCQRLSQQRSQGWTRWRATAAPGQGSHGGSSSDSSSSSSSTSAQPPPAAAAAQATGSGAAVAQGWQPAAAAAAANMAADTTSAAPPAAASAVLSLTDLWLLLRHDRRRLLACVGFTALSVSCAVMVAPSLGQVVDIISRGTAATPRQLAAAVGKLGAVYICSNVSLAVQVALALALGESMAHRLRCRLFGVLLQRDTLFFDQVRTGQMAAWLGQDIEVLQSTVAKLLGARGIRSAFETLGIIAVLFTLSWPLAVALLVSAPLLTPLIAQLGRRIGTASKASQAAANDVSAAANEIVENMRVVKLFAQQQRELHRFQGLLEGAHKLALKVLHLQAFLDGASRIRNTLCVLCTLGLGAYMALQNTVTLGVCYSFFVFSFSFAFALGNLTNTVGDVARAAGAVNRAMQTMQTALGSDNLTAALADMPGATVGAGPSSGSGSSSSAGSLAARHDQQQQQQEQPVAHVPPRRLPDGWQGDIEFRHVSFRHPGWSGWTLDDVSFCIPAGKKVALVGPSGGGKSTIASMLMGFYGPAEGRILVDGVPLGELDLKWWRRQLGVVMQEPGLLTGRVADIIRYGAPDATDADVEWAAQAAQAAGFISALPQGYQTVIGGASGLELSGGQLQRLAIARALLPRPRVLVFDEATSALDVETEQGVTQELEAAGHGVTSLIIAHRLSTVRRADSIVVVAAGRVVEQGTHQELMGRQGGVYWGLVTSAESKGQDAWDIPPAPPAEEPVQPTSAAQQQLAAAA